MRLLLYIFTAGTLALALGGCGHTQQAPWLSPELHISLQLKGDFKLLKQRDTGKGREYVYQAANDFLSINRITDISDSLAVEYTDDKVALIMSLYHEQYTPYPGKLTNRKGCPEEFQPVVINSPKTDGRLYTLKLKANNRLVYGGCTDDSNFYSSALIFFYCKKEKSLYEIKYFTPVSSPVNDIEGFVQSVSCK